MPDPYEGNAEAAEFITRLESGRLADDVSNRLFYQAPQKRAQTLRKVELDMYPQERRQSRTKVELDEQVHRLYDQSVAQQKKARAVAEREMYGQRQRQHLDPEAQAQLTQRVYKVPMTKLKRREAANERKATHRPEPKKPERVKEREDGFKPATGPMRYRDGKQLLVCDAPPKPKFVSSPRKEWESEDGDKAKLDADEFKEHMAKLARPFPHQVTRKFQAPLPSSFTLQTKFRKPPHGVGPAL